MTTQTAIRCQHCNEREAVVTYTQTPNFPGARPERIDLCARCARPIEQQIDRDIAVQQRAARQGV